MAEFEFRYNTGKTDDGGASALEGIHVLAMSDNDARLGGRQMGRLGRKIFDPAPDGSLPKNAQVRRAQSAVVKPLRRRISC